MKHYINSKEITPRNTFDIGIKVDFTAKSDQNNITTDSIVLVNEGRNEVINHLNNVGLYEGIPYDIEMKNGKKLNFYIDFTDNFLIKDYEIEVKLKKRLSHDNFFDNAEGLTFDFLNTQITINGNELGYQILPIDSKGQLLFCSLSVFSLSMAIADQAKEIQTTLKEFISIAGYGFSAIGKIIEAGLQLAIQIAYIALMIYQAKQLIDRMIELLYPKVRYLKHSTALELCKKGCQYLGYTFKSTILENQYKNFSILPIPLNKGSKKWYELSENELDQAFNNYYPSASDSTPTLASLLSALETMFNAQIKVVNGVVYLERWDYFYNKSALNINTSLVLQNERQNAYTFDFSRNFKAYLIQYLTDYSDWTTLDRFEYSNAEYHTERNNVINQDLNLAKGLTEINIPFSMVTPKKKFTTIEKIYEKTLGIIDSICGTNGALQAKKSRNGYLQISQQYFGNTKCFISDSGSKKIASTNDDLLSATSLWNNFHVINEPQNYRFIIVNNVKIPMNSENFDSLLSNNFAIIDGVESEILNAEFFDDKGFAEITYRQPSQKFKINTKLIKVY